MYPNATKTLDRRRRRQMSLPENHNVSHRREVYWKVNGGHHDDDDDGVGGDDYDVIEYNHDHGLPGDPMSATWPRLHITVRPARSV